MKRKKASMSRNSKTPLPSLLVILLSEQLYVNPFLTISPKSELVYINFKHFS